MELTVEGLVAAGVPQEVATKIVAAHKAVIEGNFIPKSRFDEVNNEAKTLKTQVSERDKQITELSKFKGTAEELAEKVKAKDDEFKASLEKERKLNAVKFDLLADAKHVPHDVAMVTSLINMDNIKLDDTGKIVSGLSEQKETIIKDKGFMFKAAEQTKKSPFTFVGSKPKEDNGGSDDNGGNNFGKSLAAQKLAQSGIKVGQ